ncbi:hypothetical protein J6590_054812 [Homalodisca vitripennis]|nr:hypothetical protein J6590_054812 [Homalodisca vitripennis]
MPHSQVRPHPSLPWRYLYVGCLSTRLSRIVRFNSLVKSGPIPHYHGGICTLASSALVSLLFVNSLVKSGPIPHYHGGICTLAVLALVSLVFQVRPHPSLPWRYLYVGRLSTRLSIVRVNSLVKSGPIPHYHGGICTLAVLALVSLEFQVRPHPSLPWRYLHVGRLSTRLSLIVPVNCLVKSGPIPHYHGGICTLAVLALVSLEFQVRPHPSLPWRHLYVGRLSTRLSRIVRVSSLVKFGPTPHYHGGICTLAVLALVSLVLYV